MQKMLTSLPPPPSSSSSSQQVSEAFLQRIMALYVASHYKNQPDDLQLLSDAPAHRLFVLLGRVPAPGLPDVLCVAQVCLEGAITRSAAAKGLGTAGRRGKDGDLLAWTIASQFQDPDFAALSGGRVVRIATHPVRVSTSSLLPFRPSLLPSCPFWR